MCVRRGTAAPSLRGNLWYAGSKKSRVYDRQRRTLGRISPCDSFGGPVLPCCRELDTRHLFRNRYVKRFLIIICAILIIPLQGATTLGVSCGLHTIDVASGIGTVAGDTQLLPHPTDAQERAERVDLWSSLFIVKSQLNLYHHTPRLIIFALVGSRVLSPHRSSVCRCR